MTPTDLKELVTDYYMSRGLPASVSQLAEFGGVSASTIRRTMKDSGYIPNECKGLKQGNKWIYWPAPSALRARLLTAQAELSKLQQERTC